MGGVRSASTPACRVRHEYTFAATGFRSGANHSTPPSRTCRTAGRKPLLLEHRNRVARTRAGARPFQRRRVVLRYMPASATSRASRRTRSQRREMRRHQDHARRRRGGCGARALTAVVAASSGSSRTHHARRNSNTPMPAIEVGLQQACRAASSTRGSTSEVGGAVRRRRIIASAHQCAPRHADATAHAPGPAREGPGESDQQPGGPMPRLAGRAVGSGGGHGAFYGGGREARTSWE